VALLQDLTRAITAAVLQDDLDRAASLLEQRQIVLQHLDWSAPAEDLGNSLEELWNLDQSLMAFCRSWREAFAHLFPAHGGLPQYDPQAWEVAALGDWRGAQVVELNQFLTSPAILAKVETMVQRPLTGLRPVVYYGCQGQRPPAVTGHPQAENPTGIDRLLTILGAEVSDWPHKTDCCGASHAVSRPDLVAHLVGNLYLRALERGANCVVTGCQMCQANLDLYQAEIAQKLGREVYLPVFYFTELLGLALGHTQAGRWLNRHLTSPRALLAAAGLAV
jgi:hypothetical protein